MKRFAIGLCALLALTGCYMKTRHWGWEQKINAAEASQLVTYFSAKQELEKKLVLEDSRVFYDDAIKSISLEYTTMEITTFCEARLLMVKLVDEFLDWLNSNPILSTQLEHYPFTADDLYVSILFKTFYAEYVDPMYVGLAILEDGVVTYFASDIKDNKADWSHQRIEPYYKSQELAYLKEGADEEYPLPKAPRIDNDRIISLPQSRQPFGGASGEVRPGPIQIRPPVNTSTPKSNLPTNKPLPQNKPLGPPSGTSGSSSMFK